MRRSLHFLLAVLTALPAFAVLWSTDAGQVLFVLYRQPKLVTIGILGWLFVALFVWHFGWRRHSLGHHGSVLESEDLVSLRSRPGAPWLLAFLVYMATTGLWVRVAANYRYELRQYVLLALLALCLCLWLPRDAGARQALKISLMLSLAVVSWVGLVQAVVPLPWLNPINPEIGALNPSFMGYKNPMALALLGQLFLVAGHARSGRWCVFWRFVLATELVYLATLGSRTSYFALAVAGVYLAVLALGRRQSWRRQRRLNPWLVAVVLVFCGVMAFHPVARQKADSVLSYVAQPSRYLESDRGIYLHNTLNMVRHQPWGVGLGDWQTHYPIYRKHGRGVAFDNNFQVRRAHSDHVQFLGEGGWPGGILWAAFVVSLGFGAHRRAWRGSGPETAPPSMAPFFAAQWMALFVAMGSDYLLELPYNKFQFFLVLVLFWSSEDMVGDATSSASSGRSMKERQSIDRPLWAGAVLVVVVMAMVGSLFHYSQLLRRSIAAASIAPAYARWVGERDVVAWSGVLQRTARYESTFVSAKGETKTLHKDFLTLAQVAMLSGRREQALAYGRLSLEHHPYYSPAFRFMSELAVHPAEADAWRRAYDVLMYRAKEGWQGPYPDPPTEVEMPQPTGLQAL